MVFGKRKLCERFCVLEAERKEQRRCSLSEIGGFNVHAIGLPTVRVDYEDREVSLGMGKGVGVELACNKEFKGAIAERLQAVSDCRCSPCLHLVSTM